MDGADDMLAVGGRGGQILLMLPEAEFGRAGIDLLLSAMAAKDESAPCVDLRGAIDRRSLRHVACLALPNIGRLPVSSSALSPLDSGGGGETRRIVLGCSRMERVECRLGMPTVDAGDGGTDT